MTRRTSARLRLVSARAAADTSDELPTEPSVRGALPRRGKPPADDDAARYASLELLGSGAMGAVHLCHDRRIGRDVAMKVIRECRDEGDADLGMRLRFEHEARVQGQLEHPAIVPVHDIGRASDGSTFFTMKRVQGASLAAILTGLRRGDPEIVERYGRRRLLGAFATVCLAVAFAHSRGVIHRDIKPSNIMLGDFGEVYLLDWGIAKVRRNGELPADETWQASSIEVPSFLSDMTRGAGGGMLGTIGYMAPEQLRGDVIDERADIYALGATLFELLTLVPLHPRVAIEAIASTLRGADARAHVRAPERNVPLELEQLCVRATARDPEDRPACARVLHDLIERLLDGDRDVARRRELAAAHTERGKLAALVALRGGAGTEAAKEARAHAIREAHSAMVLDPTNREAAEIMTRLALDPPAEMATDAENALLASQGKLRRNVARDGAVLFVVWLVGIAAVMGLGIRSAWPLLGIALALIAAALLAWQRARVREASSPWLTISILVAADFAASMVAFAFGPLLLVPGLLACNAVAFTIASTPFHWPGGRSVGDNRVRQAAVGLGVIAFLTPVALELAGVLSPSIAFRDGAIVLLPRAVDFPPGVTLAFLVVANVALILVPSFLATRVRDHALGVEQRALAAASRLRQLVPQEAQAAMLLSSKE
jgi:serine/threonine protein kinase